ncbi:MAG: ATP-binding protein [Desulfurococcaceae archaeon]
MKREPAHVLVSDFVEAGLKYPRQEVPRNGIHECVELGEVVNSVPPSAACIPAHELRSHVLILGATGTGKTNTAALLAWEASRKGLYERVVVVDWHGEYGELLGRKPVEARSLPLKLVEPGDREGTVEVLSDVMELTPSQEYVLEKALEVKGVEGVARLLSAVEGLVDESSWFRESRLALARRLRPLAKHKELFDARTRDPLPTGTLVIDVSEIRSEEARKAYVAALLRALLDEAVARRGGAPRTMVVLEEASHVLNRERPLRIAVSMLNEVRKLGISLVVVAQSPHGLAEEAMANTSVKVIHSVKSAVDLELLNRVLYMPEELATLVPYMERGEAILFASSFKKPVLTKVRIMRS